MKYIQSIEAAYDACIERFRVRSTATGVHTTLSTDEFRTLPNQARQEIKVQGSRFLCTALPTSTKEMAEEFVARIRKEFFNATHHCFAYRLGTAGDRFRYNDDGEPAGTGGKPILAAIDKFGMTDVVVVVTRYFGGTKLGVGGLARAYGEAAEKTLGSIKPVTRYILSPLLTSFPHTHISNVMLDTIGLSTSPEPMRPMIMVVRPTRVTAEVARGT